MIKGIRQTSAIREAYKAVFKSPAVVAKAYLVTITLTLAGTAIGLLLQTMTAYVLSRLEATEPGRNFSIPDILSSGCIWKPILR